MNSKRIGRRTVALQTPPSVLSFANIGGRMEGQGPLAKYFDELCDDSFFGEKTWEKAEATMQRRVLRRALEQAGLKPGDVDYVMSTEQVPNFCSERESPEDMRAFSKERAESCGDSAPERTWRSHGPQSPAALQ